MDSEIEAMVHTLDNEFHIGPSRYHSTITSLAYGSTRIHYGKISAFVR